MRALSQNMEEIACILDHFFASDFTVDNGLTSQFIDQVDVHRTCLSSINFFPSAVVCYLINIYLLSGNG